jgi:hypothetical protein
MKSQFFLFKYQVLILGFVVSSGAYGYDSTLCPDAYPGLDEIANASDVTPANLKTLLEDSHGLPPGQAKTDDLYKCLTESAPNQLDRNLRISIVSQSDVDHAKANLRKLTGFINNIPAGSRDEAGISFGGLTQEVMSSYVPATFQERWSGSSAARSAN